MQYKKYLNNLKDFFNKVIDVLVPIISVSLLLGIIFGPDAPFIGQVYSNITELLNLIGQDGILALVSIIIILAYLKK